MAWVGCIDFLVEGLLSCLDERSDVYVRAVGAMACGRIGQDDMYGASGRSGSGIVLGRYRVSLACETPGVLSVPLPASTAARALSKSHLRQTRRLSSRVAGREQCTCNDIVPRVPSLVVHSQLCKKDEQSRKNHSLCEIRYEKPPYNGTKSSRYLTSAKAPERQARRCPNGNCIPSSNHKRNRIQKDAHQQYDPIIGQS
jgi:hypothetical protein